MTSSPQRRHEEGRCIRIGGPVLCRECAALYFGKSIDWFEAHVEPDVPSMVVGKRSSGWCRAHLDRWLRLHTEGAWADEPEPRSLSISETTAGAGGSSTGSRVGAAARAQRQQIADKLNRGRLRSGRKPKRERGSLRLIGSEGRSQTSPQTSSSGPKDTGAP